MAIPEYEFKVYESAVSSGSTDMGDLCSVMPVIHPNAGGTFGKKHGDDFEIADPVAACVSSAKMQLGMLLILLSDGGKRAKMIIDEYKPQFSSKEEYLRYLDSLNTSEDRIEYRDGESAIVNLA